MSTSTKHTKRAKNLDTVLALATGTAKTELGDADNKSVTRGSHAERFRHRRRHDHGKRPQRQRVTLGTTSSSTPVKQ